MSRDQLQELSRMYYALAAAAGVIDAHPSPWNTERSVHHCGECQFEEGHQYECSRWSSSLFPLFPLKGASPR